MRTASAETAVSRQRHINIDIAEGAITGLIGLNGAGKSTIMKTICGFLAPSAGKIRFDGADITGIPAHKVIDHRISYIPQESILFNFMSVENNLMLPLEHLARKKIGLTTNDLAGRLENCVEKFPLLCERRNAKAGDLSGGQQKMVEFAKAYL